MNCHVFFAYSFTPSFLVTISFVIKKRDIHHFFSCLYLVSFLWKVKERFESNIRWHIGWIIQYLLVKALAIGNNRTARIEEIVDR